MEIINDAPSRMKSPGEGGVVGGSNKKRQTPIIWGDRVRKGREERVMESRINRLV